MDTKKHNFSICLLPDLALINIFSRNSVQAGPQIKKKLLMYNRPLEPVSGTGSVTTTSVRNG